MAVHWRMQFKSLLGTTYTVDIYDSNYSGNTPTQLVGAAVPFVTRESDDEDMYMPIRSQSGYLRFIVSNSSIVNNIQPIKSTDRPVVLRDGNDIKWVGFIQPTQYNQNWGPTPYEIEMPLMSIMSAMQGVDFTQDEGYVSFFSLVRTINSYVPVDIYITAPEETPVDSVFVQNNNFREFLTVAERSYRGTANKYECASLYDVMTAFCQYFGFSLHEYEQTFFCIVYPDNAHYEDIAPDGSGHGSQWGSVTLESLIICSANNRTNFSNVYRRIKGEFETGKDKMESVFAVDSFFKQFSFYGVNYQNNPTALIFYGNDEIQPYLNGSQHTGLGNVSVDSWGQIIRKSEPNGTQVRYSGMAWYDYFFVMSQKNKVGSPETAIKFNIPRKVYINNGEYAALNIEGSVLPYYGVTQGEGFIKKLYCKIKVGSYWLQVTQQGGYLPSYSWTTTESICYLMVDDSGNLTTEGAQITIRYDINACMEKFNGFAIDMPSGLTPGYYDVYFELLANAENSSDFGSYSSIDYLVSELDIRVLRAVNNPTIATPDFDKNTIMRNTNGMYLDDYEVDCSITSKRGTQYGTGAALTSTKDYVSTKYDQIGIERRAAVMNKSREMINVHVRGRQQPIDSVTYNSKTYGILSESMNWRDDDNEIRIINMD